MSERVKRFGSITILSGLVATLLSSLIIWNFGQAIDVKPLVKSVDRVNETLDNITTTNKSEHTEITRLIHTLDIKAEQYNLRLLITEKICEQVEEDLEKCKELHHDKSSF